MKKIPFVSFSNNELSGKPECREGEKIICNICGEKHVFECGTSDGKKSSTILFYRCGGGLFLGAVNGRLVFRSKK